MLISAAHNCSIINVNAVRGVNVFCDVITDQLSFEPKPYLYQCAMHKISYSIGTPADKIIS